MRDDCPGIPPYAAELPELDQAGGPKPSPSAPVTPAEGGRCRRLWTLAGKDGGKLPVTCAPGP
jgi:hypothetical protein